MATSRFNRYGTGTAVAALQVLTARCLLQSVFIRNVSAGDIHIQFHDSASTPAEGSVPDYPEITLASGSHYESDTPRSFSNGCYICASTTIGTKTLALANVATIVVEAV